MSHFEINFFEVPESYKIDIEQNHTDFTNYSSIHNHQSALETEIKR